MAKNTLEIKAGINKEGISKTALRENKKGKKK